VSAVLLLLSFLLLLAVLLSDFPVVDSVLAVASFPADPGVPILAGGFVE
jgi:hypothetical protein